MSQTLHPHKDPPNETRRLEQEQADHHARPTQQPEGPTHTEGVECRCSDYKHQEPLCDKDGQGEEAEQANNEGRVDEPVRCTTQPALRGKGMAAREQRKSVGQYCFDLVVACGEVFVGETKLAELLKHVLSLTRKDGRRCVPGSALEARDLVPEVGEGCVV